MAWEFESPPGHQLNMRAAECSAAFSFLSRSAPAPGESSPGGRPEPTRQYFFPEEATTRTIPRQRAGAEKSGAPCRSVGFPAAFPAEKAEGAFVVSTGAWADMKKDPRGKEGPFCGDLAGQREKLSGPGEERTTPRRSLCYCRGMFGADWSSVRQSFMMESMISRTGRTAWMSPMLWPAMMAPFS